MFEHKHQISFLPYKMSDAGFLLFVIATLVAYFLHHFYKPIVHHHNHNHPAQQQPGESIDKSKTGKRRSFSFSSKTGKLLHGSNHLHNNNGNSHIHNNNNISDTGQHGLRRSSSTFSHDDFECFHDVFSTFAELSCAMRQVGVQKARVVIGIDFTASNEWQGRRTFHKNSLHKLHPVRANPYQKIVQILGRILEPFMEPNCVYAYGFGDAVSQDISVFNLLEDEDSPCLDFKQVLSQYNIIAKKVNLSGPTSFAPLIRKTIQQVILSDNKFHLLFILADGQMEVADPTLEALVDASNYPLSIVMIGVGDGPWGLMEDCDDLLPSRKFDNFQFVNFHDAHQHRTDPDGAFALAALMEIPNQFAAMNDLGYFKKKHRNIITEEVE